MPNIFQSKTLYLKHKFKTHLFSDHYPFLNRIILKGENKPPIKHTLTIQWKVMNISVLTLTRTQDTSVNGYIYEYDECLSEHRVSKDTQTWVSPIPKFQAKFISTCNNNSATSLLKPPVKLWFWLVIADLAGWIAIEITIECLNTLSEI